MSYNTIEDPDASEWCPPGTMLVDTNEGLKSNQAMFIGLGSSETSIHDRACPNVTV